VSKVRAVVPGRITLAIGDGANDVNMIQSAHVGIGIMGKEGNQASWFSDFAITEFQDLRKLMFWHGSAIAKKLLILVICVIQKTVVFGLGAFYYNGVAAFSGVQITTQFLWSMYNIFLTNYFWYAWFDQPVSFRQFYGKE